MLVENLLLMATGSGLTLAGGLVGYLVRPRRDDPQQCGCGHHWAVHDPEKGECHGTVEVKEYNPGPGDDYIRVQRRCPCRQYTGEKPIDLGILNQPLPELSADARKRLENDR